MRTKPESRVTVVYCLCANIRGPSVPPFLACVPLDIERFILPLSLRSIASPPLRLCQRKLLDKTLRVINVRLLIETRIAIRTRWNPSLKRCEGATANKLEEQFSGGARKLHILPISKVIKTIGPHLLHIKWDDVSSVNSIY